MWPIVNPILELTTDAFRELLSNNSKNVFRTHVKKHWHFQNITVKQY